MKQDSDKITMVTAYDYPSAKSVEQAKADIILVGDSLGMVVLGYESTINVTMEDMIHHGKAARRGAPNTFIVVDMPFMSYHISMERSLENAKRLYQETGAQAIKVEGGTDEIYELVHRLTHAGIPVIGHVGLTPQLVNVFGGFKVQGKDQESAERIVKQAQALENSGVIACVLEGVPKTLSHLITNKLSIPTIGIGAGIDCDGQVLVYHDLLQYGVDRFPRFVKTYANFNTIGHKALTSFIEDVKTAQFPEGKHSYLTESTVGLPEEKK